MRCLLQQYSLLSMVEHDEICPRSAVSEGSSLDIVRVLGYISNDNGTTWRAEVSLVLYHRCSNQLADFPSSPLMRLNRGNWSVWE